MFSDVRGQETDLRERGRDRERERDKEPIREKIEVSKKHVKEARFGRILTCKIKI